MHHVPGIYNGIWSGMATEDIHVLWSWLIWNHWRNPEARDLAFSMHAYNSTVSNLDSMRGAEEYGQVSQTQHKKEAKPE
jgi:hypothetical protein